MEKTWMTWKELKEEVPARDYTEQHVHTWARLQIRYCLELAFDRFVNDFPDGRSFMNALAEPDESAYDVDMDGVPMIARLWMAQQYQDDNPLWEVGYWSDITESYVLSWSHNETLHDAITRLANAYVTMQVTLQLHALFERLGDALSFRGVTGDMLHVTVHDHDPLDDPRQRYERVEHPLGTLTYYPLSATAPAPTEVPAYAETMVLHVQEWGFYLAFACSVCNGIGPCTTCHTTDAA